MENNMKKSIPNYDERINGIAAFMVAEYGMTLEEAFKSINEDIQNNNDIGIAYYESDNGVSVENKYDISKNEFLQYIDGNLVEKSPGGDGCYISYTPSYDDLVRIDISDERLKEFGITLDSSGELSYIEKNDLTREKNEMGVEANYSSIKFLNSQISEYRSVDRFNNNEEITKYRIRFPKESEYSEFSIDTKIEPRANEDGLTSYLYISDDFKYKAVSPGKNNDGSLDWENKKEIKISGLDVSREFNKSRKRIESKTSDIKDKGIWIKFLNSSVHEYKVEDKFYGEGEHSKYRIRLPEESSYREFSIDTKIKPIKNKDGISSFIYIDPDYSYKLIAPGKDKNGKLNWDEKEEIKIKGAELKVNFELGMDSINKELCNSQTIEDKLDKGGVKNVRER